MNEKGFDPYNKEAQDELSIEAVDLILTEDIKGYSNNDIVNPEFKGPKKKGAKAGDNTKGSEWRLTA